jgi:hypothetical protein
MEKINAIFVIFGPGRPGRSGRRQGGARKVIEESQGPLFQEGQYLFADVSLGVRETGTGEHPVGNVQIVFGYSLEITADREL